MAKRLIFLFTAVMAMAMAAFADPAELLPFETDPATEAPKHEMRGAWVATVYGIDWPSRAGTSPTIVAEQKRELQRIFDVLKEGGLNSVLFQVRSMSDAMYPSALEPWSAYLTGPERNDPGWDPLAFAVAEAHERGMELHAWVNPFRLANGPVPPAAKVAKGSGTFNPGGKGWTLTYRKGGSTTAKGKTRKGKGRRIKTPAKTGGKAVSVLDPGNPQAREHIVEVCREIVRNYDVDGLVFDDYFYPDGLPLGSGYDFDEWKRAGGGADGMLSQADWRRDNVAVTINMVHDMIEREKPWVRFGVSPAGVAGGNGKACSRYGLPTPAAGNDWMYDRIFCDPLSWLNAGSIDYISPQIYWASTHETNPYAPIAQWWGKVALTFGRHCFPSQKVVALPASTEAWAEQEKQININRRNSDDTSGGSIFYSSAHICGKNASGLAEYLKAGAYGSPALMPPMEWKKAKNPGAVSNLVRKGDHLHWKRQSNMRYVVYAVPENVSPLDAISSTGSNFGAGYIMAVTYGDTVTIPPGKLKGYWFAVAPYDRYGNEWEAKIAGK